MGFPSVDQGSSALAARDAFGSQPVYGQDFLARFAFVGIFIVENVLHAIHFEFEVDQMVLPAVAPLPYVPWLPHKIDGGS